MKKIILFCVFTFLFTSQAFAGFYLSAKAGYSFINSSFESDSGFTGDDSDNGFKGSFAFGGSFDFQKTAFRIEVAYDISDKFKTDLNYKVARSGYSNILESQKHDVATNFYLDFKANSFLLPYIGAGFGFAILDNNETIITPSNKTDESDVGFGVTLNLMLGLGIKVHKNVTIDVGYKFNYYTNIRTTTTYTSGYYYYYYKTTGYDQNLLSNDLHVGLRFTF